MRLLYQAVADATARAARPCRSPATAPLPSEQSPGSSAGMTTRRLQYTRQHDHRVSRRHAAGSSSSRALMECVLSDATFVSCDLTRAVLTRSPLNGADLRGCEIAGIRATLTDLAGTVLDLEQAAAVLRRQAGVTVLPVGVPTNHSPTEGPAPMPLELINPEELPTPATSTQVIAATGSRLVFVAGQEPEDEQ